MEKKENIPLLLTKKTRIVMFFSSLSTLIFAQNYCINVCPFLDSISNEELIFNLFIVFLFHMGIREILFKVFPNTNEKRTLPRHMYYLSILSWLIAGIAAFILHFIQYPNFPIGSHAKILSSYWILGAAVLAQLEYIFFEKEYKTKSQNTNINFYNEKISKRIMESFLILTIAPALTILLILTRYYEEFFSKSHIIQEIGYILLLFIIVAVITSILFGKMLHNDTSDILTNIKKIKDGDCDISINLSRSDELGEIANSIESMAHEIQNLNDEILSTQSEVVNTMGEIAETRSKETGNHVKRVALYSELLALKYGLDQQEATLLKQASPMHDIGKVGIPDNILNKPGRHTPEESVIMKTHAKLGFDILKNSNKAVLKVASIVAYEHHEKWDGSGYPRGISGEDIHIYGRITAIADVFDALGSHRAYKKAWDDEKIFDLFKEERGKHFDPKIVDIFFENLEEFLSIRETLRDKF